MKAIIGGVAVEGTPQELATFQQIAAGPIAPAKPKPVAGPVNPPQAPGTTKVLSQVLYDTVMTMRDYGDPIKAAGIGTLMGVKTTTASGRLDALKERGLVEQYPNSKTWRLTAVALTYNYVLEGMV